MTDLAVDLRRRGYDAVGTARRRRAEHGGATGREGPDDFEVRLLGRRAVVVRSDAGARAFYDESLVRRADAVPAPVGALLFGSGAVHGLDDVQHAERKQLLRSVLEGRPVGPLVTAAGTRLQRLARTWPVGGASVHADLVEAYGVAALGWVGWQGPPGQAGRVSRELFRIVDGFGGSWPAYPRAWWARARTDRLLTTAVRQVREGRRPAPAGTALAVLAAAALPPRTAAVELGNLVRPTVAVSWLGAAAAVQLARHPEWKARLATEEVGRDHLAFAQEVRRTTPFVPVLAGRLRRPARVGGVELDEGDRIVLDVWGIDQDPRRWSAPARFDPARFLEHSPGAFELVPQGGGDVTGHRCPGESLTLRLLCETARVLARARYRISGPVGTDRGRMPPRVGGGVPLAPVPAGALHTQG